MRLPTDALVAGLPGCELQNTIWHFWGSWLRVDGLLEGSWDLVINTVAIVGLPGCKIL